MLFFQPSAFFWSPLTCSLLSGEKEALISLLKQTSYTHTLVPISLILLYFNVNVFESLPPGWKSRKGRSAVHWCGHVTHNNCTQRAPKICCNHKWIFKFSQQSHDLKLAYNLVSVYVHLLCVSTRVCLFVHLCACVSAFACVCSLVSVFVPVFVHLHVCTGFSSCVCCYLSHLKYVPQASWLLPRPAGFMTWFG